MGNCVFRDITVADKCVNPFIKLILKTRGSKKLFSSSENAKKYLNKTNGVLLRVNAVFFVSTCFMQ